MQREERLLNAAAATLAAAVVTDSAAEHYRAAFHHPVMFAGPGVSAAALAAAIAGTLTPARCVAVRRVAFAASIATGVVGSGFHIRNVSRRVGGWNTSSLFYGAPLAAPLAVTMAGLLGLAAMHLAAHRTTRRAAAGGALGSLVAGALMGTSAEAGALHFRGAFQNPFMYAPVVIPPAAAAALAAASVTRSPASTRAADRLLRLTAVLGAIGTGFHAWGVHRRMGGWGNWRQNVLAGPPLPAPSAFIGLALAGLAALELRKQP